MISAGLFPLHLRLTVLRSGPAAARAPVPSCTGPASPPLPPPPPRARRAHRRMQPFDLGSVCVYRCVLRAYLRPVGLLRLRSYDVDMAALPPQRPGCRFLPSAEAHLIPFDHGGCGEGVVMIVDGSPEIAQTLCTLPLQRGGGGCGQGAENPIAKNCWKLWGNCGRIAGNYGKIAGKSRCHQRTSRGLQEQHVCTGGSERFRIHSIILGAGKQ